MHIFSPNDIDRVRMLVRDLTIKALIPWVEKRLKLLHEVVTIWVCWVTAGSTLHPQGLGRHVMIILRAPRRG